MKKRVTYTAFFLLSVGLGYLIWWDVQNAKISFLPAFLIAQVPSAVVVGLIGLRGFILAKRQIPYALILRANGLALAGSMLVPARLSEFAKPFYFNKTKGLPHSEGLAIVVKERVWDLVGLTCLVTLAPLIAQALPNGDQIEKITGTLLAVGGITFVGMLILPYLIKSIPYLRSFDAYAQAMKRDVWWKNVIQLFLSVIIWLTSLVLFIVFYSHTGLTELTIAELTFVFLVSTLGLIVNVTPGGLGSYEAVIVSALMSLGVTWDSSLAFAIGFRFSWMAIPFVIGGWALIKDGPQMLRIET